MADINGEARKCGTCIGRGWVDVEVHELQGGGSRRDPCAVCNGTGSLPVRGGAVPPLAEHWGAEIDLPGNRVTLRRQRGTTGIPETWVVPLPILERTMAEVMLRRSAVPTGGVFGGGNIVRPGG